jgi:hypothetical protein
MATHTSVPNENLSRWYFAVAWSQYLLRQAIVETEAAGQDPSYHIAQLAQLEDLGQFLKMSWDTWLDQLHAGDVPTEVHQ